MNTRIIMINEKNIDEALIEEAGDFLNRGELVAFPTETVYGLGADATNPEAVKNIFEAKRETTGQPFDSSCGRHRENRRISWWNTRSCKENYGCSWPGPLTIILKKSSLIPSVTSAGLDSVGIRMPSNIISRKIIRAAGVPIAAPSANISEDPVPLK